MWWQKLVEQLREAGWRKVLIITVVAIVVMIIALGGNYGMNSNASAHTLPAVHATAAR